MALFETIYQDWRLYVNFFQPVLKLLDKHRIGSQVVKTYDTTRTPYQRVLDHRMSPMQTKTACANSTLPSTQSPYAGGLMKTWTSYGDSLGNTPI